MSGVFESFTPGFILLYANSCGQADHNMPTPRGPGAPTFEPLNLKPATPQFLNTKPKTLPKPSAFNLQYGRLDAFG